MEKLYHGSHVQALKKINPKESRYNKQYVYAVSELAFALLFSVPVRNSFIASWGRLKDSIPYFCEKRLGAFDLFYSDKQCSIYVLDAKDFFQKENLWREEYISEHTEKVVEEIKVADVKEYLLDLEKEGKFKLITFNDRKLYFPNIDEEAVKDAMEMIKKYRSESILKAIKKWRPDILEEVELELDRQE